MAQVITKTPLRLSFVGGGSDFPEIYEQFGGRCVSAAIDKYVTVVVNVDPAYSEIVVKTSYHTEQVDSVDRVLHPIVRECLKKTGMTECVNIRVDSDVTAFGSGLGASGALTVGLLEALYGVQGIERSDFELFQDAVDVELDQLGHRSGVQDHYMSIYSGFRDIQFKQNKLNSIIPVVNRIESQALVDRAMNLSVFAGMTVLFKLPESRPMMGVVGDITKYSVDDYKMMAYLTSDFCDAVKNREFISMGRLIGENWDLKRKRHLCLDTFDSIYEKAKMVGACGGKVLGTGGGGHAMIIAPLHHRFMIENLLDSYGIKALWFEFVDEGVKTYGPEKEKEGSGYESDYRVRGKGDATVS